MKIDDAVSGVGVKEDPFVGAESTATAEPIVEAPGISIKEIIFCPDGPEGDYLNHPMNFMKSEGLGDVIRGVTGFLQRFANINTLKLAILSILFGLLKMRNEKLPKNERSSPPPSNDSRVEYAEVVR